MRAFRLFEFWDTSIAAILEFAAEDFVGRSAGIFKRTDVGLWSERSRMSAAALVVSEIETRIVACIERRAVRQKPMCLRGAAVVAESAQQRAVHDRIVRNLPTDRVGNEIVCAAYRSVEIRIAQAVG